MSEAFVYLWYDAPNKKYYLGSHKGSPDDSYTHSSSIWESFTKDNIPEGVTRRILAYGTHEEMLALENKLQMNRKERCWDRYYNDCVCDGLYYGFGSRENNPQWKGGVWASDPKKYRREQSMAYRQTPKCKASVKKRKSLPEWKARKKKYDKEYSKTPEYNTYQKKYRAKKKTETQGEGTLVAHIK